MWQAFVRKKSLVNGELHIVIEYTKGGFSLKETYTMKDGQGAQWLHNLVTQRIARLEALQTFAQSISVGEIDLD